MPRTLDVRQPGTRCCTTSATPRRSMAEAEALVSDLEILANPIRLQLLDVLLANEGEEVCVCDLEQSVPVKQPTVSHHLRLLREAGLVTAEKRGQWSYYRVERRAFTALKRRLAAGLSALD
jgi:ArsR family transcriptional regulator